MDGQGMLTSIEIDEKLFKQDKKDLERLIVESVNDARLKANSQLNSVMSSSED
jgi:DNA-binding protein YbaB